MCTLHVSMHVYLWLLLSMHLCSSEREAEQSIAAGDELWGCRHPQIDHIHWASILSRTYKAVKKVAIVLFFFFLLTVLQIDNWIYQIQLAFILFKLYYLEQFISQTSGVWRNSHWVGVTVGGLFWSTKVVCQIIRFCSFVLHACRSPQQGSLHG